MRVGTRHSPPSQIRTVPSYLRSTYLRGVSRVLSREGNLGPGPDGGAVEVQHNKGQSSAFSCNHSHAHGQRFTTRLLFPSLPVSLSLSLSLQLSRIESVICAGAFSSAAAPAGVARGMAGIQ